MNCLISKRSWSDRFAAAPSRGQAMALALLLPWLTLRRAEAEERLDFKTLYYKEDSDRVKVFAPSVLLEHELSPTWTIKIEGVYNAISGATPTGAPPVSAPKAAAPTASAGPSSSSSGTAASTPSAPQVTPPASGGGGGQSEGNDRRLVRIGGTGGFQALPLNTWAKAGATPAPAPAPAPTPAPSAPSTASSSSAPATSSSGTTAATPASTAAAPASIKNQPVPKANTSDHRYGLALDLIKTWEQHTFDVQLAFSTESDYVSQGLALRDAIDFNQKNTTLLLGGSVNLDKVQGFYQPDAVSKNSYEGMVGVTQLLDPQTFFTANVTLGQSSGYLSDPYKVAELNGTLVPDKRPDSRNKQVVYLALNHYIEPAEASAEVSYRYYHDTFGIMAHTVTFAWYQKLGEHFILRPMLRYYQQGAANFYAVQFAGSPEFYSADYRLSDLSALGYGLKLIWKPSQRLSFDVDFERYEQQGHDGVTSQDAYPSAAIIMVGATLWF